MSAKIYFQKEQPFQTIQDKGNWKFSALKRPLK